MTHGLEQTYSIQILRAVAATTMAWLHTWTDPLFGLFGVDLFFVISGFVMCMVVGQSNAGPVAFLMDRITRIVPLYWAVTSMVLVVAWTTPSLMGTTTAEAGHYIQSLLFIPHFRNDGQLFPMLMVGWSLNYEMLFYALIALTLVIDRARFARWLASVLVAMYAMGWLFDPATVGFDFLHDSLWFEFILGMIGYHIHRHRVLQQIPKPIMLALAIGCYVSMVWLENTTDRFWTAGVPSFFLLLFALQLEGEIRRVNSWLLRVIVHIGDASYATYLSHMFVIGVIERVIFVRLGIQENIWSGLFTLACCLAAGSAIYYLIDKPLVQGARRLVRRLTARRAVVPH